ncbi:MAG: glutamate carboxypeptidase [Solirubrobacteraceae bacterium]|jgi:glutamate carboxypeptidase|nr:glutamate carboxypeptidase [Solirubrobacteraceae bacterium]MEA2138367.1 glutamate carboxypeptidase [Solirubrobacteraceae bacterium]
MDEWIATAAGEIAARAPAELERLVAISSPSGDVAGADAAIELVLELVPPGVRVERPPCSSAGHADDLIVTLPGSGRGRIVLLGHVDTVHAHEDHRPLERDGDTLIGSGAVDMKGGDVLAAGVLRALARRSADFEEVALLLVCDEEWRAGDFVHARRFAGYDACLCFEGGELTADGDEAVVVRRKAAGTLRVLAHGRSAHSGAAPDKGANALLALASAAQSVAALHDPHGPAHLTSVPTVVHSGETFNVVPAAGELLCDLRADDLETFDAVLAGLPSSVDGVRLEAELLRRWPGMDSRAATAPLLARAAKCLGRPIHGAQRGGASDASYLAPVIDVTVDGLGPCGGGAHTPGEFVVTASLRSRAELALALAAAVLS